MSGNIQRRLSRSCLALTTLGFVLISGDVQAQSGTRSGYSPPPTRRSYREPQRSPIQVTPRREVSQAQSRASGSSSRSRVRRVNPQVGSSTRQATPRPGVQPKSVALNGHCPVCIIEYGKWVKGSPRHQVTYDGITYYFPDAGTKQNFLADPARYVPALGGDCTVCYAKLGKRVRGSVYHSAIHEGRLFLFPGRKEKNAFLANPNKFAKIDLALKGDCAVCVAENGATVPGSPEFTAVHNGFRYQFPSDRDLQVFLRNPERYASSGSTTNTGSPGSGRRSRS